MERKKIVIIGNGMVGNKVCQKLKQKSDNLDIIVFAEESIRAYDRVHLTDYFKVSSMEELFLSKKEWYEENNVKIHLNDPIVDVNRSKKRSAVITRAYCPVRLSGICNWFCCFCTAYSGRGKGGGISLPDD